MNSAKNLMEQAAERVACFERVELKRWLRQHIEEGVSFANTVDMDWLVLQVGNLGGDVKALREKGRQKALKYWRETCGYLP
jgi:hypothetical protein